MEARRYTYVDVYYNANEQELANRERKNLEKRGYELQVMDDGGRDGDVGYDFCDQYIKRFKSRKTQPRQ